MVTVFVSHFEDIVSYGEVVTIYCVNVNYSEKTYVLGKRYSDFADLYSSVQDRMSGTSYQFPKKSLFNNAAQFTKERRLRGFDELLKILSKMNLYAPDLQKFLEINERMPAIQEGNIHKPRSKKPVRLTTRGSFMDTPSPDPNTTDSVEDLYEEAKEQKVEVEKKKEEDDDDEDEGEENSRDTQTGDHNGTPQVTENAVEVQINEKIKKAFWTISGQSVKVSAAVYGTMFLLGIIDFYAVQFRKMILTWFALYLLVCFVFIISIKNEASVAKALLH